MALRAWAAPLKLRAYRLLWIGRTVSQSGDALIQIAFIFAVLKVGGSASDIGFLFAIQTITRVAFTLIGGVWADRISRRYIMLASDLLRAVIQAVLAALLMAGTAQVWELGLGAAAYGAAQAFFGPASTGLAPELVPPEQLQQANALIELSGSFFQVTGPAVGGILVTAFSPGLVFAIDSASFIVSAVSLGMLKIPPRPCSERKPFRDDLALGWHELAVRPWYWLNLIAHALWNVGIAAFLVLGPVIAARRLGGASAWGLISACWAAGAIGGGIIALRLRPRRPLIAANLALLLGALPLLALALPIDVPLVGAAAALAGVGLAFMSSVWTSTMQQLIPDQVRSRVDSYDWFVSLIAVPAGYAAIGPAAVRVGDTNALVAAALVLAIPCSAVLAVPCIRAVRRIGSFGLTTAHASGSG